jgi:hypothetical protein
MDTRSRSLPVEVQHHLNAKLYGALPLCVVLGHKALWWFQHRFVQLCGYQFDSQHQTRVFDFCDAFAYTELLRPQRIERAIGEQLALTEFLINSIDAGKYPIVMVNNTMLTRTMPAIREFLVYGYSDAGQTLHIVGFGADTRFSALTFPASKFEAAFASGLARMRNEPRTALFKSSANDSQVTHVIQVLSAPLADEAASPTRIRGQVRAYLDGIRPADFDLHAGWWWYSRAIDVSREAPVIFGIATYDYLIEHLQSHAGRQGWHDYPMFHTHFEHKRLVLHRLRLLSPAGSEDPSVRSYERLVTEVDRARMQVLMSERQGKPLPHDLVERFAGFRAAETEILTAWLEQLHARQAVRGPDMLWSSIVTSR